MKNLTKKVFVSVLSSMILFVTSSQTYYQVSYGHDNSNVVFSELNKNDNALLEEFAELTSEEFVDNVKPHDLNPIVPAYVGWQDDLHSGMYFWSETKTGKCISNILNPSVRLKELIKDLATKAIDGTLTKAILIKKLKGKGISSVVATEVAGCIYTYWMK